MADEQHGRSCRKRSSPLHSYAQHDSHPCGRAGAIAVKHSARAPKETLLKRRPRQERERSYLNAQTCSLRREFGIERRLAQEISGGVETAALTVMSSPESFRGCCGIAINN